MAQKVLAIGCVALAGALLVSCGGSPTQDSTTPVTPADNRPPIIAASAIEADTALDVAIGTEYRCTIAGSDLDGDRLTIVASTPLVVEGNDVVWTPADSGTYHFWVCVVDPYGASSDTVRWWLHIFDRSQTRPVIVVVLPFATSAFGSDFHGALYSVDTVAGDTTFLEHAVHTGFSGNTNLRFETLVDTGTSVIMDYWFDRDTLGGLQDGLYLPPRDSSVAWSYYPEPSGRFFSAAVVYGITGCHDVELNTTRLALTKRDISDILPAYLVTLFVNHAPSLTSARPFIMADTALDVDIGEQYCRAIEGFDENGDLLTIHASPPLQIEGNEVVWTPTDSGMYYFWVYVTDPDGESSDTVQWWLHIIDKSLARPRIEVVFAPVPPPLMNTDLHGALYSVDTLAGDTTFLEHTSLIGFVESTVLQFTSLVDTGSAIIMDYWFDRDTLGGAKDGLYKAPADANGAWVTYPEPSGRLFSGSVARDDAGGYGMQLYTINLTQNKMNISSKLPANLIAP